MSQTKPQRGENGTAPARTRDAGLLVVRSEVSMINEIFALPPAERQARLIELAREQHDEAAERARANIRRILEGA
jgi:hypothetical protein